MYKWTQKCLYRNSLMDKKMAATKHEHIFLRHASVLLSSATRAHSFACSHTKSIRSMVRKKWSFVYCSYYWLRWGLLYKRPFLCCVRERETNIKKERDEMVKALQSPVIRICSFQCVQRKSSGRLSPSRWWSLDTSTCSPESEGSDSFPPSPGF